MKQKLLELAILNDIRNENKKNGFSKFFNNISYHLNDELSIRENLIDILDILSKQFPTINNIDEIKNEINNLDKEDDKNTKVCYKLNENIDSLILSINNEKINEPIITDSFYIIDLFSGNFGKKSANLIPKILTDNNIDYIKDSNSLLFVKITKDKIIELFKNDNNLKGSLTPKNFSKVYTDIYSLYEFIKNTNTNTNTNSIDFLKSRQEQYKIKDLIILNNNLIKLDHNFGIEEYNKFFNEKVKTINLNSFVDLNEIQKICDSYLNKNKIANKL